MNEIKKKRKRSEKGSITLFTLVAMLFFITVLILSYSGQMSKISLQRSQIAEIKRQYSSAAEKMEEIYQEVEDMTPPTVNITTDKDSPTNSNSIIYTFTFSEPVIGFTAEDITITNGIKGIFTVKSSREYTLVVTNTGSCAQTVSVAEGACWDTSGNGNKAGSKSMIIDNIAPKVIITGQTSGVNDGIIAYYDANNNLGNGHSNTTTTWNDISGNERHGTIHGATISSEYVNLDGVDDWVDLGEIKDKNTITLEATIKLNAVQSGEVCILSSYEGGGMGLHLYNGKPAMQIYVNGAYKNAMLNEVLDTNRPYTISGTYDGTNIKLYVDGILHATTAVTGTIGNPLNDTIMAIGTNPTKNTAGGGYANIGVYSVRIYDKALTQAQIKQNMNADRIKPVSISTNDSSVTLSFVFDEPVQGFTEEDITVTNGTKGTLQEVGTNHNHYVLPITNIAGGNYLEVSVLENSYTDMSENKGESATTRRYRDVTGPYIQSNGITKTTSGNVTTYKINFHESSTGLTTEDITIASGGTTSGTMHKP